MCVREREYAHVCVCSNFTSLKRAHREKGPGKFDEQRHDVRVCVCVCVCVCEREVYERESVCVHIRESVCMCRECMCTYKRECVYVCI